MKKIFKKLYFLSLPLLLPALAVFAAGLSSCQSDLAAGGFSRTYRESVQKVRFTDDSVVLNIDKLDQDDVFLLRVNTSGLLVPAANTGRVQSARVTEEEAPRPSYAYNQQTPPRGHPAARRFTSELPPIGEETLRSMSASVRRPSVPARLGEQRYFWVEDLFGSGRFIDKPATLKAAGRHGNIWVMNDNWREISTIDAQIIAEKFDLIYPLSANLLGFEFGGFSGGGRDKDPKIQILMYDIIDMSGSSSIAGYFWSKDFFPQSFLDSAGLNIKTNLAEIFYLNASTYFASPDFLYTTLIHELQHMINFNMKDVMLNRMGTPLWYNEMLSAMAEDVISPLIGVAATNRFHPTQDRMPIFLENYNLAGVTEWDFTLEHYAMLYAFGAYLMRNYGGPALLSEILANRKTGIDSVTAALQKLAGVTFEQALSRFGEAMIYSGEAMPAGAMSFDRTVSSRIGNFIYTAHGFDIWAIRQRRENVMGPAIFEFGSRDMRPHSILLQSHRRILRNASGSASIRLERPNDAAIELYLLLREADR